LIDLLAGFENKSWRPWSNSRQASCRFMIRRSCDYPAAAGGRNDDGLADEDYLAMSFIRIAWFQLVDLAIP
jgi:hypothetical protein